ncbi:putative bifunctional diguanylate cyclase/phosphodiesterase [Modestobacter sp. VKM Ac-2984]|uniref:putative bifunctional diguanylate cyclase/phosphodiesterase n=1 Tax=Modestobacter sp. VKM Ac-2984 TaxID=3004138 RepID=UPI0022AAB483|nr:bifunctional diguanylate cyclase/phosphodiesterase [Modestobacter sp. VKM Ac-2984]MCZ2817877.1 bifunctional diguanylate cyclase/phosphodiesterase [Modestobacter sp. VKM Ac-2984]
MATPRMMARILGTFYVAAGVAGLFGVLGPGAGAQGRWEILGMSVVVLVCAAVSLRWGARWPRHAFHVPVGSASVLVAVVVWVSPDPATAMTAAALLAFVAVDACFFFSLPLAWLHMAFGIGVVTAALLAQGHVPLSIALALDSIVVAMGTVVRGLVLRASSASRDPLTGLANRRGFDDALQELLATAGRTGDRLSAALLDLDHFKQINDTSGHEAGDLVLCRIADVWRRELPADAVLSRHGGDEFALLLPGTSGQAALDLVRRVAARHPEIGLSCGVAEHHRDQSAADLMRRADRALYDAKAAGRGRAELEGGPGSELARDLAAALAAGDVLVQYQPIVSLPDGATVGVEALARWTHPEHGPVPPTDFVAVAEQTGLVITLGNHVLRTACSQLAGVRTPAGDHVTLGVNVSGRELSDPDYPQRVYAVLAETSFPAAHLVLEVTENVIEGESPTAVAALHELRAAGLKVSIDDFGTGYSSLSRLDMLPADVLKLDRSFIETVSSSARRAQMLQSLVAMCRALGLDVVAEGVETAEQEATVRAMGCTFAQGWRYGRAVSLPELLTGLRAGAHAVPQEAAYRG